MQFRHHMGLGVLPPHAEKSNGSSAHFICSL